MNTSFQHPMVSKMRLVKVKRKQEEKSFGNLKLVFTLLNVCELTQEGNDTTLDFHQIYNVTEVWNLDMAEQTVEQAQVE
ncbi:MAG TPA: hypothetical protein VJH04_04165 [archaeon]|nr:hypothetical protein [archaeon]